MQRTAERERADVLAALTKRVFLARVQLERDLLLQVGRVEPVVPVRVVHRAAQRVRAAARHHRDGEARAVSLRGVEVRRLDADFFNLVGIGRAGDAAAEAIVLGAVDRVVVARVAAVEAAPRAHLPARGARRAFHVPLEDVLHVGFGRRHARREARQQDGHVREHRERLDHAPIEVLAGGHRGGVQQRRLGRDGDLLRQLPDFQRQGHTHGLTDGQRDAGLVVCLVALQFDANRVGARVEQDGFEVALAVGQDLLRLTGVGIRDSHSRGGNDAVLVLDDSVDIAASLLGLNGQC